MSASVCASASSAVSVSKASATWSASAAGVVNSSVGRDTRYHAGVHDVLASAVGGAAPTPIYSGHGQVTSGGEAGAGSSLHGFGGWSGRAC